MLRILKNEYHTIIIGSVLLGLLYSYVYKSVAITIFAVLAYVLMVLGIFFVRSIRDKI